ncbi:SprB repeat-containing protein [Flavisolibacter tropicus]|uniref:Secretion system C-terminal sorting domain-containing protein n=1 Tax=Flavisolibacter tropicus TaxID=1492898 RepID=A0A172U128_9BACT|nr:SprB repeat-containing protein [Flavisolibacter tropicus]ANE52824.1 hypothetical protein SY85_22455 [Flavisolibacter tropicus]
MQKFYKQLIIAVFFAIFCSITTVAQPIKVELKITKLSANYTDGSSNGSRFRFQAYTSSSLIYPCIKRPESFTSSESILLYPIWLPNVATAFNIVMTTHNERKDGSDDCTAQDISDVSFKKPDLHEASSSPFSVVLRNYAPGKFVPLERIEVNFEGTKTYADLEIRYTIPTPETPIISGTDFCADNLISLNTVVKPNPSELRYEWQYALPEEDYEIPNPAKDPRNTYDSWMGECGHWETVCDIDPWDGRETCNDVWFSANDCDLPTTVMTHSWRALSIGNSPYDNFAVFTPLNQIFGGTLTEKRNASFRVRAVSGEGQYSEWSAEKPLTFLPPAPVADKSKFIIKPSCSFDATGSITIPAGALQSQSGQIRWILKAGERNSEPCNGEDCGASYVDGSGGAINVPTGSEKIEISGLAKGGYTLLVLNPGSTSGSCYKAVTEIFVAGLPDLQLVQDAASNVSCFGGSNGSFKVHATGGDASSGYQFKLTATANTHLNTDFATMPGGVWELSGLPADTYRIDLKNTCSPIKSITITITQPAEIKAEISNRQPTCNTPSDGRITANVTQGDGNYVYQLWKDGTLVSETTSTATNQTWEALTTGSYTVKVLDADRISCAGWLGTTTLSAPPAIDINTLSIGGVSCFGGNDGKLAFTAKGGKRSYSYQLQEISTSSNTANTIGVFTGLLAGNYELTITNEPAAGCIDNFVKTIVVPQRDPLDVSLNATSISCKGEADGRISATATGGSGNYEYQWQYWDGASWKSNPFWFSTDTEITALEPGRYRLTIKDRESAIDCSITSGEVLITEPTQLKIDNITISDAVCKADGARIAMAASGGSSGYQYYYTIDGGATYTGFSGSTPLHTTGSYALKVIDSKGCWVESDRAYSVLVPSVALGFSTTLSNFNGWQISCKGAADGQITIAATGGNEGGYSGYSYKLNSGAFQTSNVFDHLTAGTYTVTVRDGRGCEVVKTLTLKEPETLGLAISKTDINCFDASTGAINATIEGGTAAYTLKLNGTAVVPGMFNNLIAGDYTYMLQDANGCSFTTTVTLVNKFPALTITRVKAADIKCFGEKTNIEVTPAGGNGVYSYAYSDNDGVTWKPFTAATLFSAGTYKVRVTDGVGCTTTYADPVVITAPTEALDFTYTLSDYNGNNISCFGGSNGWAALTATGGNGSAYTGYAFALDAGAFQDAPLLNSINAGAHQLQVKDGRGCIVSKTITFTQSTVALSVALVSKQDVTCQHDKNGAITVKGTGGTGLLRYALNGDTPQDAAVFTGLAEGTYTVSVIDANNCSNTITVTIGTVHTPIVINSVTVNDIVCKGDKGRVLMTATGGSGSVFFEYAGDDMLYKVFTSGASFAAGQYQLHAKDAAGCIQPWATPVIITEPATPLSFTTTLSDYNGVNISCVGQRDGEIQLTPSGGNDHTYNGYMYALNGGAFAGSSLFTNLAEGIYQLRVKDGRGCVVQQDVTLRQPTASLTLRVVRKTDVLCAGAATGLVELEALGGTAPYRYSKDGVTFQSSSIVANLYAGTYGFTVQDANGCQQLLTVTAVDKYPALMATHTMLPVNCFNGSDGQVQLTVKGGLAPYSYLWSGTAQTTQHLQNVPAGTYTVILKDAVGCELSHTAAVTQPIAALTATLATKPACAGSTGGRIAVKVNGGSPPYQYSIDNGNSFQEEPLFTSLIAGAYAVVVKDKNGCTYKTSVVVAPANEMPTVNFLVATRQNALDTLVIREVSVPAPDSVSWAFDPAAIVIKADGVMPQIRFREPGSYWVTMTGYFKGCDYTLRKTIEVRPYDPIAGPVTQTPVRIIDTVTLTPNPNGGQFDVQVRLGRKQKVILQVLQMGTGNELMRKNYEGTLLIEDRFSLGNVAGGTYVLRVITENDSQDVLFIIAR